MTHTHPHTHTHGKYKDTLPLHRIYFYMQPAYDRNQMKIIFETERNTKTIDENR